MNFEELRDFLKSKMKMSHVYQPLLIKSLIEAGGSATIRQMAITFLAQDESQIHFYEESAKRYAIHVLRKHGVITCEGKLINLTLRNLPNTKDVTDH